MTAKQLIKRIRELVVHDDPVVLLEVDGIRHEIDFVQVAFAWDKKRIVITVRS